MATNFELGPNNKKIASNINKLKNLIMGDKKNSMLTYYNKKMSLPQGISP